MNEGQTVKSYSPWNGGGITAIHKWAVKSSIAQGEGWRGGVCVWGGARKVGEPCRWKSKAALDPGETRKNQEQLWMN